MNRLLIAALIVFSALPARAEGVITQTMIERQHEAMEAALNQRANRRETVRFLHDHISETAYFRMTVDNPVLPAAYQGTPLNLSKADYINSYIQGTNFIANYSAHVETTGFSFNNGEAVSTEVITERGEALDPMDMRTLQGRPFVSRTTCQTRHILQGEALVTTGGTCHTAVSFEQSI